MDIEDLSKTQLLLLTILVNFVTSMATAIIAISMLDTSSPTVTQTVNRIVERTIEVAANETPLPVPVTVPGISEKPVVVTEEQLLTKAIAAAAARDITIMKGKTAVGSGVYLPTARAVATLTVSGLPREVVIVFPDGSSAEASLSRSGDTVTLYGFSDSATLPEAPAAKFVGFDSIAAGQTVVALAADGSAARGIVSKVDTAGISTTLAGIPAGSAAVNLSGDIIGISAGGGSLVSAGNITALLEPPAPASP